jgi:hypothetical protein
VEAQDAKRILYANRLLVKTKSYERFRHHISLRQIERAEEATAAFGVIRWACYPSTVSISCSLNIAIWICPLIELKAKMRPRKRIAGRFG